MSVSEDIDHVDDNAVIVIDSGSGRMKAGFSGEELPSAVFASHITKVRHRKTPKKDGSESAPVITYSYPIENGIVVDFDGMEKLWRHCFRQLGVEPEERAVLLTEPPLNPLANREKTAELFFEGFQVPAMSVQIQAVLSLYAAGSTSGCVLDSGHGVTHVVPVFEGHVFEHAVSRMQIAGDFVTHELQRLVSESTGVSLARSQDLEICRRMKERLCYVATDFMKELMDPDLEYVDYELPDGQVLEVGPERFAAPEVLFRPELGSVDSPGVHTMVYNCLQQLDVDARATLQHQVHLSGGNTLIPGFSDRLELELTRLLPVNARPKVTTLPGKEGEFAVWIGGSVLGGLKSFQNQQLVFDYEWQEYGTSSLYRNLHTHIH